MIKSISFCLFVSISFFSSFAQNKNEYKVVNTFHIASAGGWDYIAVNKNKIYVSHSTQVNILDEKTGDSIGVIPNTSGVHGIAFANDVNKGYTSNGRANTVTVFDLNTNQVLSQVTTGENPDAILYDPYSKKIITCNGRSKDLSVIDVENNKVIATIPLGDKPEESISGENGKLYINLEDKNEIAVINMNTFTVENNWTIAPGDGPTGLKIDTKTKRLFASCNKLLMVIDAENGKVVDKIPIGEGADGVAFDAKNNLIFTSNGEGTITVIKEKGSNEFIVQQTVTTKPGARTIAIDEKNHALFLPTAEFEPADPQNPKARRKTIAGTFQVLVVKKD